MSSSGNARSEIEPQIVMIRPPSGACQPLQADRGAAGELERQRDRITAREQDAEGPDEDEVVRGVRERARIASLSRWIEMSQYIP